MTAVSGGSAVAFIGRPVICRLLAQGGTLGDFTRENWFDPADFITSDVELLDIDADGDLEIVQLGAGVVSGNPAGGFKVYLFENATL